MAASSVLAAARKSMNPAASCAPGRIRSARRRRVAYSWGLKHLGWPAAARLSEEIRRSRRVSSDIAFPHLLRQVFGGPPGEGHDAEGDVLVGLADEGRGVHDEQVLHVVGLG